ncbi:MAG: hypothetical protein ACMG6E_10020 [Candidatus Roizmanbacteria bacterium]
MLVTSTFLLGHWHAASQPAFLSKFAFSQANARLHLLDVDRLLQLLLPNLLEFLLCFHEVLQLRILPRLVLSQRRLFLAATAGIFAVLAGES